MNRLIQTCGLAALLLSLSAGAGDLLTRRWSFDGTLAETSGGCPMRSTAPADFVPDGSRRVLSLGGNAFTTNDDPAYDLVPGMSFACRVKVDRLAESGWTTILSKGHVNTRGAFVLRVDPAAEGRKFSFFVNLDGRPEPRISSSVPFTTNAWYDVAAGWDGTNVWLAVNGEKASRPRTGPASGCSAPLEIGPFRGEVADLAFAAPRQPVDTAAHLAPIFRLACAATFDRLPAGENTLIGREREYLLRYDVPKGGQPGHGAFCFWVWLDGGWEPRARVETNVETGRRYNLAASWDGERTYLHVDGKSADTKRSGVPGRGDKAVRIGGNGVRVEDVALRVQEMAKPVFSGLRIHELLPKEGDTVTISGALANLGTIALSNCVLVARPPVGATVTPTRIDVGDLPGGTAPRPLSWKVDPGTNEVFQIDFTLLSDGRAAGAASKSVVLMPRTDPPFLARDWNPPVKPRRTYHVDASDGRDDADGLTPATAWKSFANVAKLTLGPGDRLLLKRGSVFSEELALTAGGDTANWAEIGAYGEGPRPVIRRNRFIDDRCALIRSTGHLVVRDLIVCNAGKGLGIICARGTEGLLVERCLAHHVEGLYRFNAHGIPEWRDRTGAPEGPRGGIGIGGTPRMAVMRDCEMYQCSSGFSAVGRDIAVIRVFCHDNICHNTSPHPFYTSTHRAWLLDSVFDASGWNASAGTMGIMLGYNDGLVIRNCHFLNQPDSGSHDEGGVDFEAGGENCLIDRCTFRNNAGAAIEVLGLRSPQARNTHIRNCRFDRNNVATKLGPAEIFVWGGSTDPSIVCSSGLIEGNGYVLNPGICFYTNQAVRTRPDWIVTNNVQYACSADLDRALPHNNPPMVSAGAEIWTDSPSVTLAGTVASARRTTASWEQIEGPVPVVGMGSVPVSLGGTVPVVSPKGTVPTAGMGTVPVSATFPRPGDYRLQLTVDDGEHWRTARTAVHVLPKGAKVMKAWTFSRNLDAEGWTFAGLGTYKEHFKMEKAFWDTFSNPVHLVCGDYYVLAVRESGAASLASPDGLDLNVGMDACVVLRLQNHTPASAMRLSFTTTKEPLFGEANSRVFPVRANDDADTVYVVPLKAAGTLQQLRLDLSADGTPATGTVRVDYVWIGTLK